MTKRRVVSLLPAGTEIVHSLGAASWLVGRSHACDYPAVVQPIPAVTAPSVALGGSGVEIDRAVKSAGAEGRSLYQINISLLRELTPEVIITQGQCPVCAVSPADVERALVDWPGPRPTVVSLTPARFSDLWTDFWKVASALGIEDRIPSVVGPLKERVVAMIGITGGMTKRPRIACVEWLDPLMLAGNWVPDMIELAGGEPLGPAPGKHSGWITLEALVEEEPEVLALMPCGFDLSKTVQEMKPLQATPSWKALPAVRSGRVYAVDGNALFNRPGPRLVDSLEILAHILHPNVFPAPKAKSVLAPAGG
ncbi:MAG TPA: ABC transporter substrate-binding protein [Candidatus Limnocylindria bacterium]|nr:ABC transporter substrate-binding protein [Candidatus Limnocylindria bacterium]